MTNNYNRGAVLDSIQTEEQLMARCRLDELTGCWLWQGAMQGAQSRVYVKLPGKRGKVMNGGRAALVIRARAEPTARVEGYRYVCHDQQCVNPDHCKWMTRKQIGALIAKSGVHKGNPAYRLSNTRNARKRAKLTPEMVAEIRASHENNCELGRRLGVAHTTISAVRLGKHWKDTSVNGSSVFAWRPAA